MMLLVGYKWWITLFHVVLVTSAAEGSLSDVTSDVFPSGLTGVVAAFGDLDADKDTDIFILSDDGKSVFILEADIDIRRDGTKFSKTTFINGKADDAIITSVVPGDFDRDSQMDVLVTRKAGKDGNEVTVEIYSGNEKPAKQLWTINDTFRDQPAIIDGNGDMVPDLFGETSEGKRAVWTCLENGTCSKEFYTFPEGTKIRPLRIPQSSAFLDLNGDLTADLCAVSEEDGVVYFEFWLNEGGTLNLNKSIAAPSELKVVGQASFVDLNGNHEINIVLPGCLDDACTDSAIFVWARNKYAQDYTEGTWHMLDVNFKKDDDRKTSFPKSVEPVSWISLPIALRIGDFNLDGYPDAVAVLTDTHEGSEGLSSFLLNNVECGSHCHNFSRTFSISYGEPLQKSKPSFTTFFDLMEDGILDILVSEVKDGKPVLRAIQQDFSGDASFLKVLVVSGLCQGNCPKGHSPYGVNQVGPTAKFESTTPTGSLQIGVASQLSQSAYFSLQLPFMLFGLGQTPNFVDDLRVGIPYPEGKKPRSHSWSTIIPNSQVIVIPYPVGDPSSWKHELYVTPSRLVLLTGASLLGTCAFIAIIVGLLQWRERREDKKEKLQEAQRFHFDAM